MSRLSTTHCKSLKNAVFGPHVADRTGSQNYMGFCVEPNFQGKDGQISRRIQSIGMWAKGTLVAPPEIYEGTAQAHIALVLSFIPPRQQ